MAVKKPTGNPPGKPPGLLLDRAQVMAMYRDVYGSAPWSLWNGSDIVTGNFSDSTGDREQSLNNYLTTIDNAQSTAQYLLKFHPEGEEITNQSPVTGTLRFKMHDIEFTPRGQLGGVPGGSVVGAVTQVLRERVEFDEMMSEWAEANGYVQPEEEEEEEDGLTRVINTVGKAGEKYPWMQEHLKDFMTMFKHGVKKISGIDFNDMNNTQQNSSVGAAPKTDDPTYKVPELSPQDIAEMMPALRVLKYEHPEITKDLFLLAKLSQEDKDVFNLAIKKLRQTFE